MADGEGALAELVAGVRADPTRRGALVAALREDAPVYCGRGTGSTARLRAFVLAAFADVGLPDEALPYVLEELQSGIEPVLVAAAARALRGRPPDASFASALLRAAANTAGRDDWVDLDVLRPTWPVEYPTTALLEILAALRHTGAGRDELVVLRYDHAAVLSPMVRAELDTVIDALPAGQCCAEPRSPGTEATAAGSDSPPDIELEDQDGARVRYLEFFAGRHSVVAFFYTRCPNPNKCSLTITKLAALRRDLANGVRLAAISYDPGYDTPARLRAYGTSRGLVFGPDVRMFRAVDGFDELREHFELRVGYQGSLVNRHAIELFLLDACGRVAHCWSRLQWDPVDVLARSAALAGVDLGVDSGVDPGEDQCRPADDSMR